MLGLFANTWQFSVWGQPPSLPLIMVVLVEHLEIGKKCNAVFTFVPAESKMTCFDLPWMLPSSRIPLPLKIENYE
jgi:hypothetical protein